MIARDRDRIFSFLRTILKDDLPSTHLFERIDRSVIPGMFVPELVSVSLGNGKLKSATIYFIEPSQLTSEEIMRQRLNVCKYYSDLFFDTENVSSCFLYNGLPIRIDPSIKTSDDLSTLRMEIIADYNASKVLNNVVSMVKSFFPNSFESILETMNQWKKIGRVAIEADALNKIGRKLRLYTYDGCGVTGLMCRGITINAGATTSSVKEYYGVYGDVSAYHRAIEGLVEPGFFSRVFENDDLFRAHNMSFRYMASEKSDYGVDAKFYFRNEGVR